MATKSTLNCSIPDYQSTCFDVLDARFNPCAQNVPIGFFLLGSIPLWITLLLLLVQSVRTATSIIGRLPKCAGTARIQHVIKCTRTNLDVQVCILIFLSSILIMIGHIVSFSSDTLYDAQLSNCLSAAACCNKRAVSSLGAMASSPFPWRITLPVSSPSRARRSFVFGILKSLLLLPLPDSIAVCVTASVQTVCYSTSTVKNCSVRCTQ
jgi:hypothetical protein